MYFNFAWRYFKAKKSTNAINIISWVSVTAIMIGTASLIIILSAFNGFESLVKSLYSSFYPDLRVMPAKGKDSYYRARTGAKNRAVSRCQSRFIYCGRKGSVAKW